ncbi:hypothetical protein HanPSC8_Chr11g0493951 [Helianthus annuus]|nr:hypothetical protein HanPSC8_Chr11g0493951 [Helianthus annuus]
MLTKKKVLYNLKYYHRTPNNQCSCSITTEKRHIIHLSGLGRRCFKSKSKRV